MFKQTTDFHSFHFSLNSAHNQLESKQCHFCLTIPIKPHVFNAAKAIPEARSTGVQDANGLLIAPNNVKSWTGMFINGNVNSFR